MRTGTTAIALGGLMSLWGAAPAAQWPPASSQPPTSPPAAEQPVRSEGGAVVSLTGCVSRATPSGSDGAAIDDTNRTLRQYVLTGVSDAGRSRPASVASGTAAATATSTSGSEPKAGPPRLADTYLLVAQGAATDLGTHLNKKVKVTGTVTEARLAQGVEQSNGPQQQRRADAAAASSPIGTLSVHSIAAIEGSCS